MSVVFSRKLTIHEKPIFFKLLLGSESDPQEEKLGTQFVKICLNLFNQQFPVVRIQNRKGSISLQH